MSHPTDKGRLVFIPKRNNLFCKQWSKWCLEHCLEYAGPYPNVDKLRQETWGQKALIVKCGAWFYLMKKIDDGEKLPFED